LRRPEILWEELIYRGRLFSVKRLSASYEVGLVVREVVQHPGSVAVVATDDEGNYILVSQFRVSVGDWTIEVPAGTLEEGEDPEDCAARELEEETGYKAEDLNLLAETYTSPGYTNERLYVYVGRARPGGVSRRDSDEDIEVVRLGRDGVLEAIRTGKIKDLKSIAGLLLSLRLGQP